MTRLVRLAALCLGFAACQPMSTLPGAAATVADTTPSCDIHGSPLGDSCTCDAGYSGDGYTCTEDLPTCDTNASILGDSCQCNIGYHGTGIACFADDPT